MQGKVCIVTGASSGIGRATAQQLAAQGAIVLLACRSKTRGEEVCQAIQQATGNKAVQLLWLDLASLQSVRQAASSFKQQFSRLDVLINNAGVYKSTRTLTPDGLETTFATNHLGHFLLTNLLLELLKASKPARILNVTAPSTTTLEFDNLQGEQHYNGFRAFGASKMSNLLFSYALARRLEGSGVSSNAVHPGLVKSNILKEAPAPVRWLSSLVSTTPQKAAQKIVYLATSPALEGLNGQFFKNKQTIKSSPYSQDRQVQERLWEESLKLTQLA